MSIREAVGIFILIAVAGVAALTWRDTAQTALAFRVARMDYSKKRPLTYIAVTNSGTCAAKWGFGGGWIDVETRDGTVTSELHFCGIMEPGKEEIFPIYLPPEAQHWFIRCTLSEASIRERMSFRFRRHWDGKVRWLGRRLLPNVQGTQQTICSPIFNAENLVQDRSDLAEETVDLTTLGNVSL